MLSNVDRRIISLDWMQAKSLPDMMTDIMSKGVYHEFTPTPHPYFQDCTCAVVLLMHQIVLPRLKDREASSFLSIL